MTTEEKWLKETIEKSERIRILMQGLAYSKCPFGPEHITLGPCKDVQSSALGGFNPDMGIRLCTEFLPTRDFLETTLTHELVHAYDYCTMNWDFKNCLHQACSEVRAGFISGECSLLAEFMRRGGAPNKFGKQRLEDCIKRRSIKSLMANPYCNNLQVATESVDKVYDKCIKDTAPFNKEDL